MAESVAAAAKLWQKTAGSGGKKHQSMASKNIEKAYQRKAGGVSATYGAWRVAGISGKRENKEKRVAIERHQHGIKIIKQ